MLKGLSNFQNLINYHNNLHVSDIWPRSTQADYTNVSDANNLINAKHHSRKNLIKMMLK